ncbi:MAG: sulfate adenylyltransferase [Gemmatimonadaceae bacterium]|nr:sulfate adenylyltransferase [Gemmatimonadaceae bacterium]
MTTSPIATSPALIAPHGGTLVDRTLTGAARDAALERAAALPTLALTPWALSDLELIATGAVSPLTGFLGARDYHRVVHDMHLDSGLAWPIPITLRIPNGAPVADHVALTAPDGTIAGLLEVHDVYPADREEEARHVYGTTDPGHPGVRQLLAQGDRAVGGAVWLLQRSAPPFPELALDPADTRAAFARNGWKTVVGFQTRNPVHRAHEYIQKVALETVDGLLLHPLVGQTKDDDVPAAIRVRSYRVLLEHYYPADRVLLAAFPAAMRYAGPREAVFHALVRKNYGCTHFVVGRDHAGVGRFYGTYDAQRIFQQFAPGELGIQPVCFEHTFYCRACGGMASRKTCPHDPASHVTLSGTRVRELLRAGELPPPEFSRPEVARVLAEGMKAQSAA